mmetsp:Transcript_33264/g.62132  ORF Transcript_33264/g.62132 Transcript_33264/m.62132 type:complete len:245 (-) Transcript_33264:210-944(-)
MQVYPCQASNPSTIRPSLEVLETRNTGARHGQLAQSIDFEIIKSRILTPLLASQCQLFIATNTSNLAFKNSQNMYSLETNGSFRPVLGDFARVSNSSSHPWRKMIDDWHHGHYSQQNISLESLSQVLPKQLLELRNANANYGRRLIRYDSVCKDVLVQRSSVSKAVAGTQHFLKSAAIEFACLPVEGASSVCRECTALHHVNGCRDLALLHHALARLIGRCQEGMPADAVLVYTSEATKEPDLI